MIPFWVHVPVWHWYSTCTFSVVAGWLVVWFVGGTFILTWVGCVEVVVAEATATVASALSFLLAFLPAFHQGTSSWSSLCSKSVYEGPKYCSPSGPLKWKLEVFICELLSVRNELSCNSLLQRTSTTPAPQPAWRHGVPAHATAHARNKLTCAKNVGKPMQIFENNVDLFTADKLSVWLKKRMKESKLWDHHHDHEPVRSLVASSVHTHWVSSPAKCVELTHTVGTCCATTDFSWSWWSYSFLGE